jgi:hypothetical protein
LDAILNENDDLGLLAGVVPAKLKQAPVKDQSLSVFLELVDFYEKHQREPDENSLDEKEKVLAWRLKGYRTRQEQRDKVLEHDRVGLLSKITTSPPSSEAPVKAPAVREVTSLGDIFDDDDLGLLGGIDSSIHNVRHVAPPSEKDVPEEIASRKPCEDFYRFEKFFQNIQRVLGTKAVMLERFSSESEASVGTGVYLTGHALLCGQNSKRRYVGLKEG